MTASSPSPEPVLVPLLLGLTVVTGLVDAVSYLALGHVFTANMTGNVVFLGFAAAGGKGLSAPRSGTAVVAFLLGAVIGGGKGGGPGGGPPRPPARGAVVGPGGPVFGCAGARPPAPPRPS